MNKLRITAKFLIMVGVALIFVGFVAPGGLGNLWYGFAGYALIFFGIVLYIVDAVRNPSPKP